MCQARTSLNCIEITHFCLYLGTLGVHLNTFPLIPLNCFFTRAFEYMSESAFKAAVTLVQGEFACSKSIALSDFKRMDV